MTKYMFLVNHNVSTTLVGDIDNGEAMHMWWQYGYIWAIWVYGVYGKSLCLPLNFSVNLIML